MCAYAQRDFGMFLHRSIAGQVLCMLTVALRPAFASTGTFDFLTYNVAGLPAFLNGNGDGYKTVNSRAIGSQLAAGAYDVVHMQEVNSPSRPRSNDAMQTDLFVRTSTSTRTSTRPTIMSIARRPLAASHLAVV
jgi:exonuclease III